MNYHQMITKIDWWYHNFTNDREHVRWCIKNLQREWLGN